MSREIKFRVWNKRLKRMFSVYSINWQTGIIQCTDCITGTSHTFGMIDCELLQFTGLKDKNGVEIYDGDILSNNMCVRKLSVVIWEEYGARFICKEFLNGCMVHWAKNFSSLSVVGNIHENPELLNKE